jgi:hypothetical protein
MLRRAQPSPRSGLLVVIVALVLGACAGNAIAATVVVSGPSSNVLRSTWTKLNPGVSPSPRTAVMAYDPSAHQVVLFGGF